MFAPRRDFLNEQAPDNYVPGLGRGATGFTTRSDIGPAKEGPTEDAIKAALAKRAEQLKNGDDDDDDGRFEDNDNEEGLFASGTYDEDDEEADRIYREVDAKMDLRRRARREAREKREQEEYELKNPKISKQFADLKRALSTVTDEEWAAIPDVGDLTGKNRRSRKMMQQQQRFYAVPDSVMSGARDQAATDAAAADETDGTATETSGILTDFRQISSARDKMLGMKLDQAGTESVVRGGTASVAGTSTSIDPKGYLTSLSNSIIKSDTEIGDIQKARMLLESVIKTNPKHAPGWIAAARLEEIAQKPATARKLVQQGCDNCPTNEDVWLENMRLNTPAHARIIVAKAVKFIPKSVKLWLEAMALETEPRAKKSIVRKALENIPQSVTLWKEAVNLETDEADARIMLARAVELVPLSVELWLALARLETDENARKVLNKARQAVRTSYEIWVAAARLEEQAGNVGRIDVIMKRGVAELQRHGGLLEREQWLTEAEKCEEEGAVLTCQAIVRVTLGQGLENEDDAEKVDVWMDDARGAIARGSYGTARAIYAYVLRVANSTAAWRAAAELERFHGTKDALFEVLDKAVEASPQSEDLWLLYAREKSASGDVDGARASLGRAFEFNPNNENIWLTAVDLEVDSREYARARVLLARARQEAKTERVWIKSVVLERQLGAAENALQLLAAALQAFPASAKLHMMKGQIYEAEAKVPQAREAYLGGTKVAPRSVPLWVLLARLEEAHGSVVRCRSVLERAALVNARNETIWLERIRVEVRAKNEAQAKILCAKALQECPASGRLWAESIWMEPRTQRKARFVDALRKCEGDPTLVVAVARLFWAERKPDKARSWFERGIKADADVGDSWAWFYKFLGQYGSADDRASLRDQFLVTDPKHGEVWARVRKDVRNFGKTRAELLELAAAELR
ncbi:PRP1 splicing factor, N-terminal-domain-containing protein [Dipodascopsis tothii]|uniref:PRP1 splicing factor, N-terminal-domain-containing protein n=1 Tax=Dipodascopsis tothii TaxID=44089 RepID=UPI0034CFC8AA